MTKDNKPVYKAKAPYNFIGLENFVMQRCKSKEDINKHDRYHDNLKTGYIDYRIEVVTPLHISNGKSKKDSEDGNLFRNPIGKYVIPANTIRGMTRYNASILSFASVINEAIEKKDIEDKRFYYRTFASNDKLMKNWYSNKVGIKQHIKDKYRFTVLERVDAGYIRKRGAEYVITPAVKLENKRTRENGQMGKMYSYTSVHEMELRKKNIGNINYMYNEDLEYDDFKKENIKRLSDKTNKEYQPYYSAIRYNTSGDKPEIDANGKYRGMLANSKYISGKRHHYLIYEEDKNVEEIVVRKEQAELYEDDRERTNKRDKSNDKKKSDYTYYLLPKEGEVKPVFYVKEDDKVIFGFTPYLRLSANGRIYDGINAVHKGFSGIDFVDSIFGCKKFRTKLSFLDAVCESESPQLTKEYRIVLGEPKASWYRGYIKQRKEYLESYNTEDFEIRGRKFYWMKNGLDIEANSEIKNDKIQNYFKCYAEKTSFSGKVKFENLTDEELGLLLYSLKQGDTEGLFNIGKGKPYGFGKCKISLNKLMIEGIKMKYSSFRNDSSTLDSIEKYIDIFKDYIKKHFNRVIENISEITSYKEYGLSKKVLDKSETGYMDVSEFSKRAELPTIDEVVSEKGLVMSGKMGNKIDGFRQQRNPEKFNNQNNTNKYKSSYNHNGYEGKSNNSKTGSGDNRNYQNNTKASKDLNTNAFDKLKDFFNQADDEKKK